MMPPILAAVSITTISSKKVSLDSTLKTPFKLILYKLIKKEYLSTFKAAYKHFTPSFT